MCIKTGLSKKCHPRKLMKKHLISPFIIFNIFNLFFSSCSAKIEMI